MKASTIVRSLKKTDQTIILWNASSIFILLVPSCSLRKSYIQRFSKRSKIWSLQKVSSPAPLARNNASYSTAIKLISVYLSCVNLTLQISEFLINALDLFSYSLCILITSWYSWITEACTQQCSYSWFYSHLTSLSLTITFFSHVSSFPLLVGSMSFHAATKTSGIQHLGISGSPHMHIKVFQHMWIGGSTIMQRPHSDLLLRHLLHVHVPVLVTAKVHENVRRRPALA
jgi:hypothetical protein